MVLTLYCLNASPPARAAMMAIEALNIPDVKFENVNLLTYEQLKDEFVEMNPQHTVPTLKDDDLVIWDSHAISGYLVNKYGNDDALYPSELKQRAIVDQRLHFDSGILFPALRGAAEPVLFWGDKAFKPENLEKIKKAYAVTEKFLTKPWLTGDNVTIADICCVATITSMNIILPIDEKEYPNLFAWIQRCSELEFYKKANAPGLEVLRQLFESKLG